MTIYKITNLINGKIYVGQTRQKLSVRWRQHGYTYSRSSGLKGAIAKYGKENFSVEGLFQTDCQKILDLKESEYINQFNSLSPNGYNLTTGGEGGYVRSEETRRLLSEANRGKGRPHTEESKRLMSERCRGPKNHRFGKPQSDETKLKRSIALSGRPRSQETKDKISAGHKRRRAALPGAVA